MSCRSWIRLAGIAVMSAVLGCPLLCAHPVMANDPVARLFGDTVLVTQDGKRVHFYDDMIKGKIVAIDFIYTSCHYSCPLETAQLAQVQRILGKRVGSDIFFYSISIDPAHDTPQVLKAYMAKFHVGPGWTFLTGKKADIDALSKRLGMYSNPWINPDGHLPHLLIGNDATGQWMQGDGLDNPYLQARMIGEFLDNFKHDNLTAQQHSVSSGAPLAKFNRGAYVFGRDCMACHTIGHGDKVGPDLLGVTNVRDPQWLRRMIQSPNEMFGEKDPIAMSLLRKYKNLRMPDVNLTTGDLNLLIAYLRSESRRMQQSQSTGAQAGSDKAAGAVAKNK